MDAESWAKERLPHSFERPNYTEVPNELWDMLPQMGDAELRVVLAVIRETLGWHRAERQISIARLAAMTGLSQQGVLDGAGDAEEKGLIMRHMDGKKTTKWSMIAPWLDADDYDKRPCSVCSKMEIEIHRHHIVPKQFGGRTTKENMMEVCVACHHRIHEHIWKRVIGGEDTEEIGLFAGAVEDARASLPTLLSRVERDSPTPLSRVDYSTGLSTPTPLGREQVGGKERKKDSKKGSAPKRKVLENGFYEEWKDFADWFINRSGMRPVTKNDFRDWAVAFGEWRAKEITIEDLEHAWVKAHGKNGFTVVDPRSLTKVAAAHAGSRKVYEQSASRVGDIVGARRIINPIVDKEEGAGS